MADYDTSKITNLGHLKKLAEKEKANADALAGRVSALEKVGAQANVIETVKVNGTVQTVTNKSVNITVPTKTSQLTNDNGYQTSSQVATAVRNAISKSGHASFQKVSAVPAVANAAENIMYLVMNSTTKHYDIYAKIKGDDGTYTMELLDDTTVDLSGKVDKETGKSLMTDAERTKLSGIEAGANNYTHPSHTAAASGLYKITVDALGHVTAVTKVTKADITGLGIPSTNTTYGLASATANGLMSKDDFTKLAGMTLATDAEVTAMLTEVFGS